LNGALISNVGDDTPAEDAGLKQGDIVIAFNGEDVLDSNDLRNLVGLLQPGTRADVTYLRDGSRRTTRIAVAEAPEIDSETIDADDDVLNSSDELTMMEAFDGAEVSDIPDDLELRGGNNGVYIAKVDRGSRAARSGLRRGDIIRQVGKTDIEDLSDFEDAIDGKDGPHALRIERQGQSVYVAVK